MLLIALLFVLAVLSGFVSVARGYTIWYKKNTLKFRVAEACLCNGRVKISSLPPTQSTRLINCIRFDHVPKNSNAKLRYLQVLSADKWRRSRPKGNSPVINYICIQKAENQKGTTRLRNNRKVLDAIHDQIRSLIKLINTKGDSYYDYQGK